MAAAKGITPGSPLHPPTEVTALLAEEEGEEEEEHSLAGHDGHAGRPRSDGVRPLSGTQSSRRASTSPQRELSRTRAFVCGVGLAVLLLIQAMNISLLTTTQSRIAEDLDAFEQVTWFTSAYLISMSALSPLHGKLSAIFSPRLCIFVSALVMALGCVVSALATQAEVFILGRAISGSGASGVYTVAVIVVLELTGPKRRGLGMGLLNAGFTFGVAAGATLAGALLPIIGWRALIYLQAPPTVAAGVMLLLAVPRAGYGGSRKEVNGRHQTGWVHRLGRLDYFGAFTLSLSLVLALYSLSAPGDIPMVPLIISPVVLVIFILNEVFVAADPFVPITLLRSRGLLFTCLSTGGYMMARWTVLFYIPTYALAVRTWTPATAGSMLIPTNAGFAFGGLITGWLHIRRSGSFYISTIAIYALTPLTFIALAAQANTSTQPILFIVDVFLNGAAAGAMLNYTLAHLLHLTPKSTHFVATSLMGTFRGFAGSFGSAVGGGLFVRKLRGSLEARFASAGLKHRQDLIRRLLGSPALVQQLDGREREIAIKGYEDALRALWLGAAALVGLMILVQALAGSKAAEAEVDDRGADAASTDDDDDNNNNNNSNSNRIPPATSIE